MQQRRVQVVHMDASVYSNVSEFVGLSVRVPAFNACSRQPHCEPAGIVIAAGAVHLCVRRSTEFGPPPHQGVIKQAPLLQVGEQSRDGLIDSRGMLGMFG
jgi:hypothetical protein